MPNEQDESAKNVSKSTSPPPDSTALVVARSVATEAEAAVIVAALVQHGIRSVSSGGYVSGFRAEAPGEVQVMVNATDLKQAGEILKRIEAESDEIDWSQIDVGESTDS